MEDHVFAEKNGEPCAIEDLKPGDPFIHKGEVFVMGREWISIGAVDGCPRCAIVHSLKDGQRAELEMGTVIHKTYGRCIFGKNKEYIDALLDKARELIEDEFEPVEDEECTKMTGTTTEARQ